MNERPVQDRERTLSTADIARDDSVATAVSPAKPAIPTKPAAPAPGSPSDMEQRPGPLFSGEEAQELRSRWSSIQTGFVDEPGKAVQEADTLVATTVKRVAEIFADERSKLEGQWDRGDRLSTEDLRMALQRYRSFFTRLLSV